MKIKDLRTLNEDRREDVYQRYKQKLLSLGIDQAEAEELAELRANDDSDTTVDQYISDLENDRNAQALVDQQKAKDKAKATKATKARIRRTDKQLANSEVDSNGNPISLDPETEKLMRSFNASKNVMEKDQYVATALENFGVRKEITSKLKAMKGLLSEFVRAFHWDEFNKDNVFIKFLNGFPNKRSINDSLLLKSRDYFELMYNDYANGTNSDLENPTFETYSNEYWVNRRKNTKNPTSVNNQLNNTLSKAKSSLGQSKFLAAIANNLTSADLTTLSNLVRQNENTNRQ